MQYFCISKICFVYSAYFFLFNVYNYLFWIHVRGIWTSQIFLIQMKYTVCIYLIVNTPWCEIIESMLPNDHPTFVWFWLCQLILKLNDAISHRERDVIVNPIGIFFTWNLLNFMAKPWPAGGCKMENVWAFIKIFIKSE